ncbi:MAG: hypothetical protein KDD53_01260, partial [Bdellovibrionales bacterium]|nr:hypothetical protein [Bdellovibrionales bacterium]
MKTFLVKIPQDNSKTAAAFEELLKQLHETVIGERIAFEILATGQNIAFCFSGSASVCEVVAGQIYGMLPDADVLEVADPIGSLGKDLDGASFEIVLRRSDLYPIKRYQEFQGDSLSGLLSVLSKCSPAETVLMQLVLQTARDSASHHFRLNIWKKIDRFFQFFRAKYWFKKGVASTFRDVIDQKVKDRLCRANLRVIALSEDPDISPRSR